MWPKRLPFFLAAVPVLAWANPAPEPAVSTTTPVAPPPITVVHPTEGFRLPSLKEVFVFGATVNGSTLTVNGTPVPVHPNGGYLTMVPLVPGDNTLHLEARVATSTTPVSFDRRFVVAPPFAEAPKSPLTILKDSISPSEDLILAPGDILRVSFQGTPQASAEFSIEGLAKHVPMIEAPGANRGLYEGTYVIPRESNVNRATISVSLKRKTPERENARGRLTIDLGNVPRLGLITEDTVAARTASDGGYDVFLYKGMKVPLTGKIGNQWRVRLSASQTGWVKESAIQDAPRGTPIPQGTLSNVKITRDRESTIISVPLGETLPYRAEQSMDPMSLTITIYGATSKTDLIRYDPLDPLIQLVRWRQITPDTCQLIIEPKLKKWWGFDVRYEGSTMQIEIRDAWASDSMKDMAIAVDAGHGGSDNGAIGPHGLYEKDANLAIAKLLVKTLADAGAKPFLVRSSDMDVPLYERPKIAWKSRARLFVSVHCNSSGYWENPLWNNGSSVYFYHPQSMELARAVHAGYRKHLPMLQDRGLYYADFAVCRMTQMPAILTEQAYIIVPEQEQMLFDPLYQQRFANAIVNGIKTFLKP